MKYKILKDKTCIENAHKLYRIQALKDFGNVEKGDLGGWVESQYNLSQEGSCWLYDEAKAYGNAVVSGDATVMDEAVISGNSRVSGSAAISGRARIADYTVVDGNACVSDAQIASFAHITENAVITDDVLFADDVVVRSVITPDTISIGNRVIRRYSSDGRVVHEYCEQIKVFPSKTKNYYSIRKFANSAKAIITSYEEAGKVYLDIELYDANKNIIAKKIKNAGFYGVWAIENGDNEDKYSIEILPTVELEVDKRHFFGRRREGK